MFCIEDERHAELEKGQYMSFEDALGELKRRATIPWGEGLNRCTCISWKECERYYQIIEFDTTKTPWLEKERWDILTISANGVKWIE